MSRRFYTDGESFNPAYSPEKCGLELVAEAELTNESYEFDTLLVWKDIESKKLYWARDSGCSCPVPFEDYHSLDDLREVDFKDPDFDQQVKYLVSFDLAASQTFVRKVREAM